MLLDTRVRAPKFNGKLLPIFKVAPGPSSSAPPETLRFAVKLPKSNVPADTFRTPLTERLPSGAATPAGLLMVKLLNVEAPTTCGTVPLNVTVPKPGVNVPPRTQSPPTEMFAAP